MISIFENQDSVCKMRYLSLFSYLIHLNYKLQRTLCGGPLLKG